MCPPITSVEKKQASVKEVSTFHLYYFTAKKQTRLVESGDMDINKLVANAVPESATKSTKHGRTSIS